MTWYFNFFPHFSGVNLDQGLEVAAVRIGIANSNEVAVVNSSEVAVVNSNEVAAKVAIETVIVNVVSPDRDPRSQEAEVRHVIEIEKTEKGPEV